MDTKQTDLIMLFDTYCEAYDTPDSQLQDIIREIPIDATVLENKQAAYDYLLSDISVKKKLIWLKKLYSDCGLDNYEPLLELLKEDFGLFRDEIEKIILDKETETRLLLEKILPELDDEPQDWVKHLFKYWDYLHTARQKVVLNNKQEAIDYSSKHIELYCTLQITWVPPKLYTKLHWAGEKDLEEYVPRHVIRYVLSEYMTLPRPIRLNGCDAIVALIDKQEWQKLLEELLQLWLNDDAKEDRRSILLPYCMYCSEKQTVQLRLLIKSWSKSTRKQLAIYSLGLLGLKASPTALITLNEFMELSSNEMFKRTASEAFQQVALRKRLTVDELADRIVPSLGFNRKGERKVDYGSRFFRVTLHPDLTITIFDQQKQNKSKKLPAPALKDDAEKAEEARLQLGGMKTFTRFQTHLQQKRLEHALKHERTWTAKAWQATYIDNPVMRYLCAGLIWGVYEDGKLQKSFRSMENGSLTTADEEVYTLPANATIALVHPTDLTTEELAKWKQHLSDNILIPIIPQLSLPMHHLKETEKEGDVITRYSGKISIVSRVYDYENEDISVLIINNVIYIIERSLNVLVQLPYVVKDKICILQELSFSALEEGDNFNNIQLPKEDRLPLSSLPARYIGSILLMLDEAFSIESTDN